jgi:hypothetical protein
MHNTKLPFIFAVINLYYVVQCSIACCGYAEWLPSEDRRLRQ